ncbi:DUF500-domain-containing protein, partial [Aureobasidium melanogenum]
MRVLNSRIFAGNAANQGDAMYNDIPVYDESHDDVIWQGRRGTAHGEGVRSDRTGSSNFGAPSRSSTWQDDVYDRQPSYGSRANPSETFDRLEASRARSNSAFADQADYSYSDRKPSRPSAPKPNFGDSKTPQPGQAIAKFTFDPDQPGDLGFKKGDIITIVKKTDNSNDWWTGRIGSREGIFPSNYVELT